MKLVFQKEQTLWDIYIIINVVLVNVIPLDFVHIGVILLDAVLIVVVPTDVVVNLVSVGVDSIKVWVLVTVKRLEKGLSLYRLNNREATASFFLKNSDF